MVTDAAIEQLFDKDLLVGVLESAEVLVSVGIDGADDRVETLDAALGRLNQLTEFHILITYTLI